MRLALFRILLLLCCGVFASSLSAASEASLVSLELRPLDDPAAAAALVVPSAALPATHHPAPAPALGDVIAPSGQAFRLMATRSAPTELILYSYHEITDTWAPLGQVALPGEPTTLQPADRGFVVTVATDQGPRLYHLEAVLTRSTLPLTDWIIIAVYLAAMLGVGWFCYRQEQRQKATTEEYFLAGRNVPWWAAGVSLYATGTSALSFIAIPAFSFATNWLYLGQQFLGVLGLFYVATKIIPVLRRLNLTSIYAFLELRFHPSIRLMSSALTIAFQLIGRLSIVLYLPALAISAVTGANVVACIVLMGVVTTAYTLIGGMKAVIWTDVIQVIVMIGGALFAIGYIVHGIDGGLPQMLALTSAAQKTHMFDFRLDLTIPTVWAIALVVLTDIPTWPREQVMMQRVFATKDDRSARSSVLTLAAILLPGTFLFYAIGTALWAFYKTHPSHLNPLIDTDATFPVFIAAELPVGITGLIIAGLFAASMSTLSSGLNSVATLTSVDFYERLVKQAKPETSLRLAYGVTIFSGLVSTAVAVLFSFFDIKSMFDAGLQLTAMLGGGFAGTYALGLFTRRATWQGALIGTAASIATAVLLRDAVSPILLNPAAVAACMIVGYLASFAFPAPRQDLTGLTVFTPRPRPIKIDE